MRRLSEKNALSAIKNSSDCIPTLTTKRITFIYNYASRLISNIYYY